MNGINHGKPYYKRGSATGCATRTLPARSLSHRRVLCRRLFRPSPSSGRRPKSSSRACPRACSRRRCYQDVTIAMQLVFSRPAVRDVCDFVFSLFQNKSCYRSSDFTSDDMAPWNLFGRMCSVRCDATLRCTPPTAQTRPSQWRHRVRGRHRAWRTRASSTMKAPCLAGSLLGPSPRQFYIVFVCSTSRVCVCVCVCLRQKASAVAPPPSPRGRGFRPPSKLPNCAVEFPPAAGARWRRRSPSGRGRRDAADVRGKAVIS